MKPTTLVNNLQKCLDSASKKNLPVTLVKCDGFGSLFYGKPNPSDLDCLVFYSYSAEQEKIWRRFHFLINCDSPNHRELSELFFKYHIKDLTMQEILQKNDVLEYLNIKGINIDWLSYYSYSEIFNDPDGMFYPHLEVLVVKMIKKGIHGLGCLQALNMEEKNYNRAQNYVFLWSPQKQNINENLLVRTDIEKMEFTKKEIEHFNNELDELRLEYTKHLLELEQNVINNKIKININIFKNIPKNISLNGNETMSDLVSIVTTLRERMKEIRKLQTVVFRIDWCIRVQDKYGCTIEEHIESEIPTIPKRVVDKEYLEKILKEILI